MLNSLHQSVRYLGNFVCVMISVRELESTQLNAPCVSFVRSVGRSIGFPVIVLVSKLCCMRVRVRRRTSTADIIALP